MSLGGGGGGTVANTNPFGTLPGSQQVISTLGSLQQPMADIGLSGINSLGGVGPAQTIYPYAQGTAFNILNNPFQGDVLSGGTGTENFFATQYAPTVGSYAGQEALLGGAAANLTNPTADYVGNLLSGESPFGQAASLGSTLSGIFANPALLDIALAPGENLAAGPAIPTGTSLGTELAGAVPQALQYALSQPGAAELRNYAVPQANMLDQFSPAGINYALPAADRLASVAGRGLDYAQPAADRLSGAASQLLDLGFDPQNTLYQRTAQRLTDQTNAALAGTGVLDTPYGGSVLGNTLGNFNIDWVNNLLGRAIQGGEAASGLFGQGGGLISQGLGALGGALGTGGGLISQGQGQLANLYGQALSGIQDVARTRLSELTGAGGLAQGLTGAGVNALTSPTLAAEQALASGANTATNLGETGLNSILQAAKDRSTALLQGLTGLGTNIGSAISGFGGGAGMLQNILSQIQPSYAAPYNAANAIQGNNFGALGNFSQLGSTIFGLPQFESGQLLQYLGLGPQAASAASQAASINAQTQMAQAQGLGSLLGQGGNLLTGGGGLGGLFGGGAGGGLTGFTSSEIAGPGSQFAAAAADPAAFGLAGGAADAGASFAPLAFLGS